jgi:hypothetical protein
MHDMANDLDTADHECDILKAQQAAQAQTNKVILPSDNDEWEGLTALQRELNMNMQASKQAQQAEQTMNFPSQQAREQVAKSEAARRRASSPSMHEMVDDLHDEEPEDKPQIKVEQEIVEEKKDEPAPEIERIISRNLTRDASRRRASSPSMHDMLDDDDEDDKTRAANYQNKPAAKLIKAPVKTEVPTQSFTKPNRRSSSPSMHEMVDDAPDIVGEQDAKQADGIDRKASGDMPRRRTSCPAMREMLEMADEP